MRGRSYWREGDEMVMIPFVRCDFPECLRTTPYHRFRSGRAQRDGWVERHRTYFCPDHAKGEKS